MRGVQLTLFTDAAVVVTENTPRACVIPASRVIAGYAAGWWDPLNPAVDLDYSATKRTASIIHLQQVHYLAMAALPVRSGSGLHIAPVLLQTVWRSNPSTQRGGFNPWACVLAVCFAQVGFMFDNALPKTRRSFRFGDISVAVRLVDDDPGAVQVCMVVLGGGVGIYSAQARGLA